MSRTYEYRSGLASQISAFIAEKRACGCKYEKEAKTFQTLESGPMKSVKIKNGGLISQNALPNIFN